MQNNDTQQKASTPNLLSKLTVLPSIEISGKSAPSWDAHQEGSWILGAHGHREAKWLSLHAEEVGERSRRAVFLTLGEAQGRELLAFLRDLYEDEA